MEKYLLLIIGLIASSYIQANDGAFFASGNQLIPIVETDITVQKEILTLKKVDNKIMEVTVYYEFFNPKEEKTITVGFEAISPMGDVEGAPKNGQHPYMSDFTVVLNNNILKYEVAFINEPPTLQNGKIESLNLAELEGDISGNDVDFYYVYHFKAAFKKGRNIIKHTYNYDVSGGVCYDYNFEYILTAANRWGNKQIDDFTLIIDNGPFENFHVTKSFFNDGSDWIVNGIGKMQSTLEQGAETLQFYIQKGNIIFQKKDFQPSEELYVFATHCGKPETYYQTPFSLHSLRGPAEPQNDFEKKVLRNLPFARRGYVFKNAELKNYYKKVDWYMPNPNYVPDLEKLSEGEKEWVERYR